MRNLLTPAILLVVLAATVQCEERTYNGPETSSLCSPVSGEVHRFYNKTQQCYEVGTKGPCGEMMIFYADPTNADTGDCDCDNHNRCHRPLIYWPAKNRCYLAFDQGPCQQSEWLVFDSKYSPSCRSNPCQTNGTSEFEEEESPVDDYWIEAYGECVKTNTQGFCNYPNEVVAINGYSKKTKPYCSVVETTCVSLTAPSLFCAPGQKWTLEGNCKYSCKKTKRNRHNRHRHHHRRPHRHHGRHHHRHHIGQGGVETTPKPTNGWDWDNVKGVIVDSDENDTNEAIDQGHEPSDSPSAAGNENEILDASTTESIRDRKLSRKNDRKTRWSTRIRGQYKRNKNSDDEE